MLLDYTARKAEDVFFPSSVVETITQEQSPRDEHEFQVPVVFESDGGWLI